MYNNSSLTVVICLWCLAFTFVAADRDISQDDNVEEIDPFDMLNFDPSQVKQQAKKKDLNPNSGSSDEQNHAKSQQKSPGSSSSSKSTENKQADEPAQPPSSSSSSSSSSSKTSEGKNLSDSSPQRKDCPRCICTGQILFKNFVKSLLNHFHGKIPGSSGEDFNILVRLTASDFSTLKRVTSSDKPSIVHDAHTVLKGMLQQVSRSTLSREEKWSNILQERFGLTLDEILKVVAIFGLVIFIIAVITHIKVTLTWKQILIKFIVYSFIISLPMTWYELYKSEEIKQQTVSIDKAPEGCSLADEGDEGILLSAKRIYYSWFTLQKDHCQSYYEHLHIDPVFKVTPTKVLSVTVVRFFLSPLKDIGASISEFLVALLKDLPIQFYPIALFMVTVFSFLFLFMMNGYCLRLPLVSIEPGQGAVSDPGVREAIEVGNRQAAEQLKSLMDTLHENEQRMSDRMIKMEQIQMAAVEYTAATQSQLASNPPTLPTKTGRKSQLPTPMRQKSITAPENLDKNHESGDYLGVKQSCDDQTSIHDPGESEFLSTLDKGGDEVKVRTCDNNVQTVGQRNSAGDNDQFH